MIDAHLHVWDPAERDYGWLTPAAGELHGRFDLSAARAAADALARFAGEAVEGAILVQAADTLEETLHLRRVAAEDPWVLGVVGWLPLREPDRVAAALDAEHGLVGVRHLFHDDPDPDMLADVRVRESLGLLAAAGLPLDLPDAFGAGLLGRAAEVLEALPGLTLVVDHLGKPPVGGDLTAWLRELAPVAAHPRTVAKVSGLATALVAGARWDAEVLAPVWEAAMGVLGPDRLMVGSDWPIADPVADAAASLAPVLELVGGLDSPDRDRVLRTSAMRVYGVEPVPSG